MSKVYTSTELIIAVKRRASIPQAQVTFQPEDFLAFADEEISIGLLPSILRLHEDYLLYTEAMPLEADMSQYVIPHRSIGNKLREVSYRDANGNIREMTRINIEDLAAYSTTASYRDIYSYYIENNEIVIYPSIQGAVSGSLMLSYYLRPNNMVLEERVAVVTSINRDTGEVFVNGVPEVFTATSKYDFINAKAPFNIYALSKTPTSVNSTTNVLIFDTDDIPERLSVGDYLNLEMETFVPQIPLELHVVLSHRVAARCLEAQGDTEGLQNANTKLSEMENNTTNLIDNRVEGSPHKVVNRHSTLRSGLQQRRYRRMR